MSSNESQNPLTPGDPADGTPPSGTEFDPNATQAQPAAPSGGAPGPIPQNSWAANPQTAAAGTPRPAPGVGVTSGKSSIGWIVGGGAALTAGVVGILFATGVFGGNDGDAATAAADVPTVSAAAADTAAGTRAAPGTDPFLDESWEKCAAGDMNACDKLYFDSPADSEYELFGSTCGDTQDEKNGNCYDPQTYGDDPELDAYWDDCAAGDLEACDDLYMHAPVETEYHEFASTCGGTEEVPRRATCANFTGHFYGDNSEFDVLWDNCEAGDMDACNDLWDESSVDTDYWNFGNTCGQRVSSASGNCIADYASIEPVGGGSPGTHPELDPLWIACAEGDMEICDELYLFAPSSDDEYAVFGATCGGRFEELRPFGCVDYLGDNYGDNPELDALWDSCEDGDMDACNDLYTSSPPLSGYDEFGTTCGNRSEEPMRGSCE